MAEETEISWCDSTMNFWWGCTKIAPACDHCYAAELDKRTGGDHWGNVERRRTSFQNWNNAIRWQKQAAAFQEKHGRRRRVFVSSMSDFYDNQIDPQWRADAWDVIRACPDIDWLILTKRPQNIRKMLPAFWDEIKERIWSGTTVEDMVRAQQNIHHILQIDSRYRFISAEPLLGPLHLRAIKYSPISYIDALTGERFTEYFSEKEGGYQRSVLDVMRKVDWVIVGGESGHGARPMHIHWADQLQMDCAATGTAFHFKQHGNHVMASPTEKGAFLVMPWAYDDGGPLPDQGYPPPHYVVRTVKKVAGTLRGVEYKEFPND